MGTYRSHWIWEKVMFFLCFFLIVFIIKCYKISWLYAKKFHLMHKYQNIYDCLHQQCIFTYLWVFIFFPELAVQNLCTQSLNSGIALVIQMLLYFFFLNMELSVSRLLASEETFVLRLCLPECFLRSSQLSFFLL